MEGQGRQMVGDGVGPQMSGMDAGAAEPAAAAAAAAAAVTDEGRCW